MLSQTRKMSPKLHQEYAHFDQYFQWFYLCNLIKCKNRTVLFVFVRLVIFFRNFVHGAQFTASNTLSIKSAIGLNGKYSSAFYVYSAETKTKTKTGTFNQIPEHGGSLRYWRRRPCAPIRFMMCGRIGKAIQLLWQRIQNCLPFTISHFRLQRFVHWPYPQRISSIILRHTVCCSTSMPTIRGISPPPSRWNYSNVSLFW